MSFFIKTKKLKDTLSNVESDLDEVEYTDEEEEPEDDCTNKHTCYSHQRKFDQFITQAYKAYEKRRRRNYFWSKELYNIS